MTMPQFFPEGFEAFYKSVLHYPTYDMEDVAVIFPSQKLLTSEYGKEIDSFSNVMRFNIAPTLGYEKHVGSKTTHRILNDRTRFQEQEEKCIVCESLYYGFIKRLIQDFHSSKKIQNRTFYKEFCLLNRQFQNCIILYVMQFFNIEYYELSAGFIGLFYCIFLSKTPPVIYGFQTIEEDQQASNDYYYNKLQVLKNRQNFIENSNRDAKKKNVIELSGIKSYAQRNDEHDFKLEKEIISVLAQNKIVIIKSQS